MLYSFVIVFFNTRVLVPLLKSSICKSTTRITNVLFFFESFLKSFLNYSTTEALKYLSFFEPKKYK
ncbi:MAG TPA: hypothetical protein DDX39_05105 [Bacteroidales bacterium]|nr:hypothetical protein [Bacteroidales bacterium]